LQINFERGFYSAENAELLYFRPNFLENSRDFRIRAKIPGRKKIVANKKDGLKKPVFFEKFIKP
jgi:hypothetical protein